MWFWPFATELGSGLGFVAGDSIGANLTRYAAFFVATSLVWDVIRGVLTAALCVVAGRPVLNAFRRASRRAAFDARPAFDEPVDPVPLGARSAPKRT